MSGQRQVPDLGISVGFSWNDGQLKAGMAATLLSTYWAGHHAGCFPWLGHVGVIYIVACGADDKLEFLTNRSVGEYLCEVVGVECDC